ncbi:MAG: T9SS type A sorting domain-containing protein [Flavobacteriales bacterium]|nr:T9SS type A sorting domain-containing protein [Flavobacteriales bacterium]
MKKIYLTVAVLAVSAAAIAQSLQEQPIMQQTVTSTVARDVIFPENSNAAVDPTDTLGIDELGNQLIFYSSNSGYVFGTNVLVDPQGTQYNLEYARGFIVNDPYNVIGAGFIFGGKEDVSGSPAAAKANLYNIANNRAIGSATSTAPDAPGPAATVLATADVAFADADTVFPNITWVDFTTAAWVGGDFAIGLSIAPLYGTPTDTLVLMADADGDSDGDYTFTRIGLSPTSPAAQTLWAKSTVLLQGGLDVNLAIFAVVAESGVGIEEQGFFNGVKMTTFPNPALTSDNVTIQYGVENAVDNVTVSIYTLNGQVAYSASQGAKASGTYNVNVPAGTLASGSYIYAIEADGRRLAKKMEILK